MAQQTGYVVVAVVALVAIAALVFVPVVRERSRRRLTPLAGVAFALVVAGIVFGEERWLGYGLIGGGVVLAVVDAVLRAARA